jgi:hypothetical protein
MPASEVQPDERFPADHEPVERNHPVITAAEAARAGELARATAAAPVSNTVCVTV